MANIMKCMSCHYKQSLPADLPQTLMMTCPKCHGMLVGPKTPGGRRMKQKAISQAFRDISIIALVIVLCTLNAKYSTVEFDGTLAQRIFAPLTPSVLMCLGFAWLQRYFARLWCMVIGRGLLFSASSASPQKRFAWIGGAILVMALAFIAYKAGLWPFTILGVFTKEFLGSDAAVGTALMLFIVQWHFTSEDYMSYSAYVRERPEDWCTGLPPALEMSQCYALCIMLTITGLLIACGPDWFSGTAFGRGLGAARDFFVAFYGLFGALAKIAIGLVIGIFNFALSLFA